MDIEEAIKNLKVLIGLEEFNKLSYKENKSIETLLTAYEKEKEINKNAICFLKHYNNDFNKMSDNEVKQILYCFDKCANIKKEE